MPTSFIIELEPILIDKLILFWAKLIYGTIIKDSTFIIFGSKYMRDFLFGTVLLYFFCYTCQQYTQRNGNFR